MTRLLTVLCLVPFLWTSCATVPSRSAQEWLDEIKSGDEATRNTGIEQLAAQGRDAAPVLAEALASENNHVRWAAQWALVLMKPENGAPAVPALIKTLECDDRRERWMAVVALGNIGPSSRAAVPSLIQLLDEDVEGWPVVWALGQIGPDAHQAIPALASLLASDDQRGRDAAVREALRKILAI